MRSLALGVLTLTSCAIPCPDNTCVVVETPAEDLETTTRAVWREVYRQEGQPPSIFWVIEGDCPLEGDPRGGLRNPDSGECACGLYTPPIDRVYVAARLIDPWHVVAHEFLHARLFRRGDDADAGHSDSLWRSDSSDSLNAAFLALDAAGVR